MDLNFQMWVHSATSLLRSFPSEKSWVRLTITMRISQDRQTLRQLLLFHQPSICSSLRSKRSNNNSHTPWRNHSHSARSSRKLILITTTRKGLSIMVIRIRRMPIRSNRIMGSLARKKGKRFSLRGLLCTVTLCPYRSILKTLFTKNTIAILLISNKQVNLTISSNNFLSNPHRKSCKSVTFS